MAASIWAVQSQWPAHDALCVQVAEARHAINEALNSFEGAHVVDIATGMPQTNSSLWDRDQLHCSRKGYDQITDTIAHFVTSRQIWVPKDK